jgi:hypothetical protein
MHPTIGYWLVQVRMADLSQQARRDSVPPGFRPARRGRRRQVAPKRPATERERKA